MFCFVYFRSENNDFVVQCANYELPNMNMNFIKKNIQIIDKE
jgi:hypothetical protein